MKRALDDSDAAAGAPAAPSAPLPTLYSYWRSSCSWRVRIGLHLKGIEFTYHAINLLKAEQKDAGFARTMNPMKAVPVLMIDGHSLTQSGAILEYLEETRPEPALLPKDAYGRAVVCVPRPPPPSTTTCMCITWHPATGCPWLVARAQVRKLCDIVGCDIQPVQNLRILNAVSESEESKEAKDVAKAAWARRWITEGFVALEAAMAECAGKYSYGDAVTMADLFLVPQLYNAARFAVDMSEFPTIQRVADALKDHPAFVAAHPASQPDAAPA